MTSIFPLFTPNAKSSITIAAITISVAVPLREVSRLPFLPLADDDARERELPDEVRDEADRPEVVVFLDPLPADDLLFADEFDAPEREDGLRPVPLRLFPDCDAIRSS